MNVVDMRSRTKSEYAGGNSGNYCEGGNGFGYNRSRRDYCARAYRDAFEDDTVRANPDIFANKDIGALLRLLFHDPAEAASVIMIDETGTTGDEAIGADFDSAKRVELTSGSDETPFTDRDGDIFAVSPCDFEINIFL